MMILAISGRQSTKFSLLLLVKQFMQRTADGVVVLQVLLP